MCCSVLLPEEVIIKDERLTIVAVFVFIVVFHDNLILCVFD